MTNPSTISKYAELVEPFLRREQEFTPRDLAKLIGTTVERARLYVKHMHKYNVIHACGFYDRIKSTSKFVFSDTPANDRHLHKYLFLQERRGDYGNRSYKGYHTKVQFYYLTAEVAHILLKQPTNSATVKVIHAILRASASYGPSPHQIYRVLKVQTELFEKQGSVYSLKNIDSASKLYQEAQALWSERNGGPVRSRLGRV